MPLTPQRVSVGVRAPVSAEPDELCDGVTDCPEEVDFGEATPADSVAVFLVVDVAERAVEAESTVTDESVFAASGRSSPFAQEQSRSAAGTRILGRMQACV